MKGASWALNTWVWTLKKKAAHLKEEDVNEGQAKRKRANELYANGMSTADIAQEVLGDR
ncbi:MAG: hypothetical protein SGJ05_10920 [bacterium]|nr:hypothetical protein [bacterium]